MKTVIVSSCLLGLATRYDGSDNLSRNVLDFIEEHQLIPIPVCPEQLAGLPTPRSKCWFYQGNGEHALNHGKGLQNEEGEDVTEHFIKGAEQTLEIAGLTACRLAILQQRSPSCGTRSVYLKQELTAGMGITAALLKKHGIEVFSDENLPDGKFLKSLHHE